MDLIRCCCCFCCCRLFKSSPNIEKEDAKPSTVDTPPPVSAPPTSVAPVIPPKVESEIQIPSEPSSDIPAPLPDTEGEIDVNAVATPAVETIPDPVATEAPKATLSAPSQARAGSTIEVEWTGPNDANDSIAIFYGPTRKSFAYTRNGSPAQVLMPTQAGPSVLKYVSGKDNAVLATLPIVLIASSATLSAPAQARAGSTLDVAWTGPNDANDCIAIFDGPTRKSFAYTRGGTPAQVILPTTPGTYQLKYIVGQDYSVLASIPISLFASVATLSAPTDARAGATIEVDWTGPNDPNDSIAVFAGKTRHNFAYTRAGSPAQLVLPTAAGTYEIKYVVGQDYSVLAAIPISLTFSSATLNAYAEARAGSMIEVQWTGPDDSGDYIGICKTGAKESLQYVYTSYGNPAKVHMPTKAGSYELKYFVGQDSSILASASITVTAASATLSGPAEGRAGSTIDVTWTGPDDSGDYIGICKTGAKDSLEYVYTSYGNPAKVRLPTKAGSYELKYFVGQDSSILASASITVIAASATLSGPAEGRAGSTIDVTWTGPDDSGDYIGICKAGAKDSLAYAYTSCGNPAKVRLPTKPGSYELKYFVGQDNSTLAGIPLTVALD